MLKLKRFRSDKKIYERLTNDFMHLLPTNMQGVGLGKISQLESSFRGLVITQKCCCKGVIMLIILRNWLLIRKLFHGMAIIKPEFLMKRIVIFISYKKRGEN